MYNHSISQLAAVAIFHLLNFTSQKQQTQFTKRINSILLISQLYQRKYANSSCHRESISKLLIYVAIIGSVRLRDRNAFSQNWILYVMLRRLLHAETG